ncbi:hypothetical protein niasHS_006797 [Heterodera schachtii]|uniref:3-beta hydroxysteroid dehydrogenase/isomerase domain-containing protein n=1 Tax=Heterodera schachtii TaxID=97005 RepID=A0ABD2JIA9_HETSC
MHSDLATSGKRLCVLGGGGYLGQLLALSLQREGHFVVLFDLHFQHFGNIRLDSKLCLKITGSITNVDELRLALNGCDACFHLAGYGMSGGPSLDREKCFLVNVEGTRRALDECRRARISRLVFTSSVMVIFDGNELDMAEEEGTPYIQKFGINAYAESKCFAEKMVLAANDHRLATCALRLRGIYGPGELRTVKRTADLCLRGVVKCTFGTRQRVATQYSGADNTVQALMLAEKSLREGPESRAAGKAYHIMDGEGPVDSFRFWYPLITAIGCPVPSVRISFTFAYTLGIFFEFIYKFVGWEPFFTRYEVALMGVPNTYSIERARRDLNYSPIPSSDQMARTIEFLKQQLKDNGTTANSAQSKSIGGQWLRDRRWLFMAYLVEEAERAFRPFKWSLALVVLLLLLLLFTIFFNFFFFAPFSLNCPTAF